MHTSPPPWAQQPARQPTPADQQQPQGPYAALYGRPQQSTVQAAGNAAALAPWAEQQWQHEQTAQAQQATWHGDVDWTNSGQAWQQQVRAVAGPCQDRLYLSAAPSGACGSRSM